MSKNTQISPPLGPESVYPDKPNVLGGPDNLSKEFVSQNGSGPYRIVLPHYNYDDVFHEIGPETFARMSYDPKIHKSARIRVHGALTDELIFAPGRTEDEVGPGEYGRFMEVMQFAERILAGLEKPYVFTLEQMQLMGLEQGHAIAEVNYEYTMDQPTKPRPKPNVKPAGAQPRSLLTRFASSLGLAEAPPDEKSGPQRRGSSIINAAKVRLMPKNIKVKPYGTVLIVVDQFGNELGLIPTHRWVTGGYQQVTYFGPNEVITRDKFLIMTFNSKDGDPRGISEWRYVYNWWNFKNHLPKHYLRQCLQEAMPIPVMELPEKVSTWMEERDANGNLLYEDPPNNTRPKMVTAHESARRVVENMYNGKGVVIPPGAKLTAYVGKNASVPILSTALEDADRQIEDSILKQQLAQSEGEHQARAASITHEGRLNDVFFWDKRVMAYMTLYDLIAVAIRENLGDWALEYMPKLSLGDSEKRDWAEDLKTISQAYFWGFIDDTQRAELMAWMSLPRPGISRQEQAAQMGQTTPQSTGAQKDVNGNPVVPNSQRPDKQPGNTGRNDGNGTPKKAQADDEYYLGLIEELDRKVRNAEIAKSGVFALGHHKRRGGTFMEYLRGRTR